jgi:hypothetical protein
MSAVTEKGLQFRTSANRSQISTIYCSGQRDRLDRVPVATLCSPRLRDHRACK